MAFRKPKHNVEEIRKLRGLGVKPEAPLELYMTWREDSYGREGLALYLNDLYVGCLIKPYDPYKGWRAAPVSVDDEDGLLECTTVEAAREYLQNYVWNKLRRKTP